MINEQVHQAVKRVFTLRWYVKEALKDPNFRITNIQEELEQLKKDVVIILDHDRNNDESLTNACLDVINAYRNIKTNK